MICIETMNGVPMVETIGYGFDKLCEFGLVIFKT